MTYEEKTTLLNDSEIDIKDLQYLFVNSNIYVEHEGDSEAKKKLESLGFAHKISEKLRSHISEGIDESNKDSISFVKKKYGTNVPNVKAPNTFLHFIKEALEDVMLQILLLASLVSLFIGIYEDGLETGWIEGVAIFFAVFIVVSINAYNNWNKEQQFFLLSLENEKKEVIVRRNKIEKKIKVEELLVGDLMKISIGQILSVDGLIVEGEVEIDESSFNGESEMMKKKPLVSLSYFEEEHERKRDEIENDSNLSKEQKEKLRLALINKYKDEKKKLNKITPFCVSGTSVKVGEGFVLVCCVGRNSAVGISLELMESPEEKTPLQLKLSDLADKIGVFGSLSAVVIMFAMVFKEVVIRLWIGREIFNRSFLDVVLNSLIVGVTVIVVAIPEGLPMAVSISLAYSVFQMKEKNCLVRKMEASETMGGVDCVCSDKTGTLTEGKMKIVQVFIDEHGFHENNIMRRISNNLGDFDKVYVEHLEIFLKALANNNEATVELVQGKKVVSGNMTDSAMMEFLVAHADERKDLKDELPKEKKQCLPFSSEYKMMATVGKGVSSNTHRIYIKGAPERFVGDYNRVSHILSKNGRVEFDQSFEDMLKAEQEKYADSCLRTILLLYKDVTTEELESYSAPNWETWDSLLNELTIVAMVGIKDPERPEVKNSIEVLQTKSKVTVRMVTGDNIKTAIAISKAIGIITPEQATEAKRKLVEKEKIISQISSNQKEYASISKRIDGIENDLAEYKTGKIQLKNIEEKIEKLENHLRELSLENSIAIEGSDFKKYSGGYMDAPEEKKDDDNQNDENDDKDEIQAKKKVLSNPKAFAKLMNTVRVISRASPDDKFLLVLGLKEMGHVVAVTGDGTNDAPALKCADVGFSMGIRGTDVAQKASSIVLLDDSFDSIVTAVKFGRNVFDCIRKFLQFQLTTNIVAVFMTLLGAIILKDSPLNAIQMLWVNLIMDTFGSLALATEKPTDELLNRKPYSRKEDIVTKMMSINIMSQAVFQILVLSIIIFYGDVIFGVASDRELTHFEWNEVNGWHFTIFFNIFVFMQVFNSVNARKLKKEETNVFEGLTDNIYYVIIQSIIIFGQIIMVTLGGVALRTQPLSIGQHLGCLFIASLSIPVAYITKIFLPEEGVSRKFKHIYQQANEYKKAKSTINLSTKHLN